MKYDDAAQILFEEVLDIIVLLTADDEEVRKAAEKELHQWKQQSDQHREIAQHVELSLDPIQTLAKSATQKKIAHQIVQHELDYKKKSKKNRSKSLFILCLTMGSMMTGYLSLYSPSYLVADIRNPSGQWQVHYLSDGTKVVLRGKSALNIHFTQQQRTVDLVQGEIYVDIAKDPDRPFVVKTTQGQIQALGTAFSVEKMSDYTQLKMLHSKVLVNTVTSSPYQLQGSAHQQQLIVHHGNMVNIYKDKISELKKLDIQQQNLLWQKHSISFEDAPLTEVLKQLDKNFAGKIFYSSDIHHLRVNVMLGLDDIYSSLGLLKTAIPELKVMQISPYFIYVSIGE